MSLHKYFAPTNRGNTSKRNLSAIPVAATIAELTSNEQNEVVEAIKNVDGKKKRGPYVKYDDHKRSEVAKFAVTTAIKTASSKYGIPENTVRHFVKSYTEAKAAAPNKDISSLPHKKRGRITLLPQDIDTKVMEMASSMRMSGAVVNYNILIAIAKGIITANDRTLLSEHGGTIKLGWKWCESVFRRMKWTNRKGTTSKPIIAPGLIKEVGLTFFKDISEIVQANNIPPELIINLDQTPLPFILISKYSMNQKGAKNVPIQGTDDYRQITGTFSVALSGKFLPMQLIYKGKTNRCHPSYEFPSDFHITHNDNHWANEETSLDLLNKIVIPYIVKTREELGLPMDHPWLLICDVFKAQWTDSVKGVVRESFGKMEPVPNNWTSYFQPLDISVNKPCKDFLRNEAQTWYSNRIMEQIKAGKLPHQVKVETRISIIKPLHAQWVTKFYDYIRSRPEIVRHGWEKSLITENIHKKIELDPFVSS